MSDLDSRLDFYRQRVRQGDTSACRQFCEEFGPQLRRILRRQVDRMSRIRPLAAGGEDTQQIERLMHRAAQQLLEGPAECMRRTLIHEETMVAG